MVKGGILNFKQHISYKGLLRSSWIQAAIWHCVQAHQQWPHKKKQHSCTHFYKTSPGNWNVLFCLGWWQSCFHGFISPFSILLQTRSLLWTGPSQMYIHRFVIEFIRWTLDMGSVDFNRDVLKKPLSVAQRDVGDIFTQLLVIICQSSLIWAVWSSNALLRIIIL